MSALCGIGIVIVGWTLLIGSFIVNAIIKQTPLAEAWPARSPLVTGQCAAGHRPLVKWWERFKDLACHVAMRFYWLCIWLKSFPAFYRADQKPGQTAKVYPAHDREISDFRPKGPEKVIFWTL